MYAFDQSLVQSFNFPKYLHASRDLTSRCCLVASTPLSRLNKVPKVGSSPWVTRQRVDRTKHLLPNNYSYSHRQSALTMAESTSLASWKLHNRFVDIVRSDVSPILDLIPSYNTLEFDYNATENTVALRMGEYGDSEILAHPNGSVSKRVVRDSKIRKVGTVLEVNRPMSGQFKAVAPFGWSETMLQGITTPMSAPAHALVLMYMHIWVLKTNKKDVELPIPRYQSLYDALVLIRNALDTELVLPVGQRKVPAEVLAAYQNGAVGDRPVEKEDVENE